MAEQSPVVRFLEARIAEDLAAARRAGESVGYSWVEDEQIIAVSGRPDDPDFVSALWTLHDDEAEHIARHDPERVIREVTAKRKLVADLADELQDAERHEDLDFAATPMRLLGIIASAWSDHPEFDPEWTVTA